MAFAIVLKGIDWQIDGAFKSAALAFLVGWVVFSVALYVSSQWDKRRPLTAAVQIVVGLSLIAIWKAYLPAPMQSVPANAPFSNPTLSEQYPFREKPAETITFIFGTNSVFLSRDLLSKKPQTVPLQEAIGPDSYNLISLHLKDGKPFVDVKMWGDGDPTGTGATYLVEVTQNEFIVRPPAWDRNFNNQAFEVVNEYGMPMLQIYYKQADVIVINGVFRSKRFTTYASDDSGTYVKAPWDPDPPPLKTVFQYPSMKHRGDFAPDWKPIGDSRSTNNIRRDRDITKPLVR